MPAVKPPKRVKFHRLKRPKFRADMKKENLYNLSRLTPPKTDERTYFQQKWTAKSLTRAYHAEHVREGQWTRMFSRRPPAVVPMNANYLAQHDGANEASGRGSGRDTLPQWLENEAIDDKILQEEPAAKEAAEKAGKKWEEGGGARTEWLKKIKTSVIRGLRRQYGQPRNNEMTPYMQMVYHPLERRLDMAVWRALFASSAKQARQFVCHGGVRVNGQLMRYPGYLLNPGDMFSVDPERALWGMGQNAGPMGRMHKIMTTDINIMRNPLPPSKRNRARNFSTDATSSAESNEELDDEDVAGLEDDGSEALLDEAESDDAALKTRKRQIRDLLSQTREMIEKGKQKKTMNSATKQNLRAFIKELRRSQSRVKELQSVDIVELESQFTNLSNPIKRVRAAPVQQEQEAQQPEASDEESKAERERKHKLRSGPRWIPRDYLSPFAFIPRYLEVNHAVCSAVYLRHPVCGPGFAEVPTPYGAETGGLAFNWYLRRR